ncbi:MAG: hypothetical protein ACREOO_18000 [bacterium]
MTELFYFAGLDLMIKVEYAREGNALRYASHREMESDERAKAEQYVMAEVAPKTDFHAKHPSVFAYLGVDHRLKKELAHFRQKNDSQPSITKEKQIAASVRSLINDSMRTYYTEKIGELLLSARNELKHTRRSVSKLPKLRQQMNELVNAYNAYSDDKVTLHEIIPSELKPFWPGLENVRYYAVPSES